MRSERAALLLSAAAALVLGAVGVAAAVATGSGAILLDGLFNLCFFATALFTLRVAALLARPDDERYPFGYLFFEPLINTVKGLLILGVSLFALVDAAIALATGGRAVAFGPAIAYAAFATARLRRRGAALLRAPPRREPAGRRRRRELDRQRRGLRRRARRLSRRRRARARRPPGRRPPRRPGDGRARRAGLDRACRCAWPAAASWRCSTAPRPPRSSPAWRRSPAARSATCRSRRLWVRAVQPGRTAYVVVHVLVPPGTALDLATADRLRGAVIAALAARHAPGHRRRRLHRRRGLRRPHHRLSPPGDRAGSAAARRARAPPSRRTARASRRAATARRRSTPSARSAAPSA